MGIFKRLFRKKSNCGKRGMTVGEVIIAIAVIVIVTISAAYTIRMSASATSRDFDYERARVSVKNALEYYKYDDIPPNDYFDSEWVQNGNDYVRSFGDFTVTITITQNGFSALIVDGKGNTKLEITNYTKGG